MAEVLERAKRKASFLFILGWCLTILNLAAVAYSVYLPIKLRLMPEEAFFFLDDATTFGIWTTTLLGLAALLAILQMWLLPKVAGLMVEDIEDVAAAEASLRLAVYTSYISLFFCTLSFVYCLNTTVRWYRFLQLQMEP